MLKSATYEAGSRQVRIEVERIDTWREDQGSVVNFPGVVQLDGDRLYMTYHRARHGAAEGEPLLSVLSDDGGASWRDAPRDFPLIGINPANGKSYVDFDSGVLGYLKDGTICRIDHDTVEAAEGYKGRESGSFHEVSQISDPTFVWRRWARNGERIESWNIKVRGLPFEKASYQSYASLLELEGGDFLTALEWVAILPEDEWTVDSRGRTRKTCINVFIVRSSDRGKTWDFVQAFDSQVLKPVYGPGDRPLDEGFDEADLAELPNGDILCVMRTGSYSPMFQSRSSDGGRTWSTPENTGWQGVRPQLQVLPSGVLACSAGRGAYGHPQITHVMLSLDGTGRHWETPFAFHTGPGCSYTTAWQRDDRLHVAFSHSDFTRELGTNELPIQAIRRAVLDIQVLSG